MSPTLMLTDGNKRVWLRCVVQHYNNITSSLGLDSLDLLTLN